MATSKVVVIGSSGTIGSYLVPFLQAKGYEVICPKRGEIQHLLLDGVAIVINLAGQSIVQGRWTQGRKDEIYKSRVDITRLIVQAIERAKIAPKLFISASAIGFYGNTGDRDVTEADARGEGFLADVCAKWEEEAKKATDVRVVLLRMAMVLAPNAKIVKAFRLGLGATLGSGTQWVSSISIDDLLAAIEHIMQHDELSGPVNASSPHFFTNKEFTKALAKSLHRPAFFRIPAWFLRIILGQLAEETILSSQRVYPKKLLDSGFKFQDVFNQQK